MKKSSIEDKKLSHQFRIISLLVLLLPTLVFLYVISGLSTFSQLIQAKYIVPYLFSIVIILSVLALLQAFFMRVSAISSVVMKGSEHMLEELDQIKGSYELSGIVNGFEALLEQYQKAGSDLQRRAVEILLIKEFSDDMEPSLDIKKLLSHLLDKAMQVNQARIGSVFLIDEDGKSFHVVCSRGHGNDEISGDIIAIKDSIVHHVMDAGTQSLLVDDIETDMRFRKKNDPKYSSPSFISLPVRSGDKLIAILNLADKEGGEHFQQNDVDLATIMVKEAVFAIANARAYFEIEQQAEDLKKKNIALEEEILRRRHAEKELEHLAHRDPLTHLPNRYIFVDRLEVAIAQAERNSKKLAILFVDLDRFKIINDSLGHAAGDKALCEISKRMTGCLRKTDLAARYGGDEFTFILMDVTELEGANNVADKIRGALEKPIELDGVEYKIGCSIGIGVYPDDATDVDDLIHHADAAMYANKRAKNGRHD